MDNNAQVIAKSPLKKAFWSGFVPDFRIPGFLPTQE